MASTTTSARSLAPLFSSASDDWPTPRPFYDRLDAEFGFGLDLCADRANHKAPAWYGLDHPDASRRDALARDWASDAGGRPCWLNPPYGKQMRQFMAKAVEAAEAGVTVVCLVPARTDTRWWHDAVFSGRSAVEVRLVKGRLKFGTATTSAPFPSAVLILGPGARPGHLTSMPAHGTAEQESLPGLGEAA